MEALADARGPSIWRQRPFWSLFVPAVGVGLEQQIVLIALPLLVYQASASAIEMNLVRAIGVLPNLLLAFLIGAFVDQADKRAWLLVALSAQVLCLVGLAIAFGRESVEPLLTYPLIFVLSTAVYAYFNAQTSAMKMALRQEDLGPATAAMSSVGQAFQMMGPAIAGILLMLPTPSASLWAAAAVAGMGLVALMPLRLPSAPAPGGGTLRERVVEGWRALRANRPLWLLTLVVIVTNCAESMFMISMLQKAQALGMSGAEIGLAFSAGGAVGLVATLLAPRVRARVSMGGACLLGMGFATLCYGAAALVSDPIALTAVLAAEALCNMVYNVMIWTLRQETTPVAVIGRVTGLTGSLFKLASPFAIVGAGFLSEYSGLPTVFVACAALNAAMLVAFASSPVLRGLR